MHMQNVPPMVSVIIPAYNAEKTIYRAVRSVLDQDFQEPVQIIVIDDHSIDSTNQVVNSLRLEHPNIELLKNAGAKGPAGAYNTGLKHAKGQYITFLDADDIWYKNHLTEGVSCLKKHPQIDLVSFNMDIIQLPQKDFLGDWFSKHRLLERFKVKAIGDQIFLIEEDLIAFFLRGCFLLWPASIVRRDIINGLFFNEKVTCSEDRDLFLQIVAKRGCRIALKDIITSVYYRHEKNLTAPKIENRLKLIEDELFLFQSYYSQFDARYAALISNRITDLYITKSRLLRRKGTPYQALSGLLRCVRCGISRALLIEFFKVVVYCCGYRYRPRQ